MNTKFRFLFLLSISFFLFSHFGCVSQTASIESNRNTVNTASQDTIPPAEDPLFTEFKNAKKVIQKHEEWRGATSEDPEPDVATAFEQIFNLYDKKGWELKYEDDSYFHYCIRKCSDDMKRKLISVAKNNQKFADQLVSPLYNDLLNSFKKGSGAFYEATFDFRKSYYNEKGYPGNLMEWEHNEDVSSKDAIYLCYISSEALGLPDAIHWKARYADDRAMLNYSNYVASNAANKVGYKLYIELGKNAFAQKYAEGKAKYHLSIFEKDLNTTRLEYAEQWRKKAGLPELTIEELTDLALASEKKEYFQVAKYLYERIGDSQKVSDLEVKITIQQENFQKRREREKWETETEKK